MGQWRASQRSPYDRAGVIGAGRPLMSALPRKPTWPITPAANSNAAIAASRVGQRKSPAEAGLSNRGTLVICYGGAAVLSQVPERPATDRSTTKLFPPNHPEHAALN